jgi:hypothetical protein
MNLLFRKGLVLREFLAVIIMRQVAGDGRSDWLKGVQLLAVYLILAVAFFLTPQVSFESVRARATSHSAVAMQHRIWRRIGARDLSKGVPISEDRAFQDG